MQGGGGMAAMETRLLGAELLDMDRFLSPLDSEGFALSGTRVRGCRVSAAGWGNGGGPLPQQAPLHVQDLEGPPWEEAPWGYLPELLPPTPPPAIFADDFMDLPSLEEEIAGFVEAAGETEASKEERSFIDELLTPGIVEGEGEGVGGGEGSGCGRLEGGEGEGEGSGRGRLEGGEGVSEGEVWEGEELQLEWAPASTMDALFGATSASNWFNEAELVRDSSETSVTSSSRSENSFVSASASPSASFSKVSSGSRAASSGRSDTSACGVQPQSSLELVSNLTTKPLTGRVSERGMPRNDMQLTRRKGESFGGGMLPWAADSDVSHSGRAAAFLEEGEGIVNLSWGSTPSHEEKCSCSDCQASVLDRKVRGLSNSTPWWYSGNGSIDSVLESAMQRSTDRFLQSKVDSDIFSSPKPARPADISDRLAAIVGPLTKEEEAKAANGPGLSVIAGAINAVTVRPPSSKPRAPRASKKGGVGVGGKSVVVEKLQEERELVVNSGLQISHVDRPLGVRKPGKSGRPKKLPVLEDASAKEMAGPDPLADLVLAARASPCQRGKMGVSEATIKQQLIALAEAVATDDQARARFLTSLLKEEARPAGEVLQRVAFHFMDALQARANGSGAARYAAPLLAEKEQVAVAMEACGNRLPYLQVFFEASNAATWEVVAGEAKVHFVDLGIWQCSNWKMLMRQLAAQPGGPPRLRLTGVDAPWVGNPMKGAMRTPPAVIGRELSQLAAQLGMQFEFHVVEARLENLRPFMIRRDPEEALAVTCTMRLQYLWDETVMRSSPRDAVLQLVRQLNPRVFTFTDMDVDLNGPFFLERFREALEFYHVMFEAQDKAFHSHCVNRQRFEADYFGRDILNVIGCEGMQRVVRSERLEKWQARVARAGLSPVPFSARVKGGLERLLKKYPEGFSVKENGGALQLAWNDRSVLAVSAWRPLY